MRQRRKPGKGERRGYVMLLVLVLLLVLISAAAFSLRAIQSEVRSGSKFRKSELLVRAAEAGIAHRMAEISITSDPIAVTDDTRSTAASGWNDYPPAGTFVSNQDTTLQYRTSPVKMVWSGKTPPPGYPIGTNTYIFQITSYSVGHNLFDESGEAAIDVGVKTWDALPSSYAP